MPLFSEYLAQGQGWMFFPAAFVLGALHGLEPGHSKTMMTAFIVAVRGTVGQAVLLGLAATFSHTLLIWVLAFLGLHYSNVMNVEGLEPYFQTATGIIVLGMAVWMFLRARYAACTHTHGIPRNTPDQKVTTGQIILFGLSGGLLPCPAAFAVLLLCLQAKKVVLGFALVMGFSLGLAFTLVMAGVIAAISLRHAARKWKGLEVWGRKLPYASAAILASIGIVVAIQGLRGIK